MKDLEPILDILCNYQAGYVLSEDELLILRNWLAESDAHGKLFDEIRKRKGMNWLMGEMDANPREQIQQRLIEMEENGPE